MYLNESASERANFFANSFTKAIVYSMIFNVRFDMLHQFTSTRKNNNFPKNSQFFWII